MAQVGRRLVEAGASVGAQFGRFDTANDLR